MATPKLNVPNLCLGRSKGIKERTNEGMRVGTSSILGTKAMILGYPNQLDRWMPSHD